MDMLWLKVKRKVELNSAKINSVLISVFSAKRHNAPGFMTYEDNMSAANKNRFTLLSL